MCLSVQAQHVLPRHSHGPLSHNDQQGPQRASLAQLSFPDRGDRVGAFRGCVQASGLMGTLSSAGGQHPCLLLPRVTPTTWKNRRKWLRDPLISFGRLPAGLAADWRPGVPPE